MAELESVIGAVCTALEASGITRAMSRYPEEEKFDYTHSVAAVGLKKGSSISYGLAEYIGEKHYTDGSVKEIYGKKLDMTLAVELFSPDDALNGSDACLKAFDKVLTAAESLTQNIKVREIKCGEVKYDENTMMFKCSAELIITALLYAEKTNDIEFLDFNLEGVSVNW